LTLYAPRAVFFFPLFVFLIIAGYQVWAILLENGGMFVFTLDDPYIHLALAENIIQGHYGVNPGEVAAPASSILWPFLLAPLTLLENPVPVVLVLNLLLVAATLWVSARALLLSFPGLVADEPRHFGTLGVLSIFLLVGSNAVGVAFTGMEHSLQVLCGAVAAWGLMEADRTGRIRWWFPTVLVLAPLVRYESLVITVPALVYLFARGHRRAAVWGSILVLALLGAFSGFLLGHGLSYLPSSILAKASFAEGGLAAMMGRLPRQVATPEGVLLSLLILAFAVRGLDPRVTTRDRWLAAVGSGALVMYLVGGKFSGQSRYEIFLLVFSGLLILYEFRTVVARYVKDVGAVGFLALVYLGIGVLAMPYVGRLFLTPLASNNIFEQQYQMHRFVTEIYQKPVAVNDIGYVSWRNDQAVLDLWGLASQEALELRRAHDFLEGMDELVSEKGVRLAMIYEDWFPVVPRSWVLLGTLELSGPAVSSARSRVQFFVTEPEAGAEIRDQLREFRQILPPGPRFLLQEEEE
jgi:hypothetical protein